MLHDDVKEGVSASLKPLGVDAQAIEKVSDAITSEALADPQGRQLLAADRDGKKIVHYHTFRGITAAAGVLGAGAAFAGGPITWPAACAAIGALGAVHGLRTPLPQASARIVLVLYLEESKEMSKDALLDRFRQSYHGQQKNMESDFVAGLRALERVNSIREERGNIRLIERIVIRY